MLLYEVNNSLNLQLNHATVSDIPVDVQLSKEDDVVSLKLSGIDVVTVSDTPSTFSLMPMLASDTDFELVVGESGKLVTFENVTGTLTVTKKSGPAMTYLTRNINNTNHTVLFTAKTNCPTGEYEFIVTDSNGESVNISITVV